MVGTKQAAGDHRHNDLWVAFDEADIVSGWCGHPSGLSVALSTLHLFSSLEAVDSFPLLPNRCCNRRGDRVLQVERAVPHA